MEAYKQYSKEEREYHVEQWRSSGKSQKAYSTEAGISVVSLHYWVYGEKKKEKERTKKVAIAEACRYMQK